MSLSVEGTDSGQESDRVAAGLRAALALLRAALGAAQAWVGDGQGIVVAQSDGPAPPPEIAVLHAWLTAMTGERQWIEAATIDSSVTIPAGFRQLATLELRDPSGTAIGRLCVAWLDRVESSDSVWGVISTGAQLASGFLAAERNRGRSAALCALQDAIERVGRMGTWSLDIDTQALSWSAETYALHQVTPETYQPTVDTAIRFYDEASQIVIRSALQRAILTGEPYDVELDVVTAAGRRARVRTVGQREAGAALPPRVIGLFQDITRDYEARRELESSERYFRALAESAPMAMCVSDVTGHVSYANARWRQNVGIVGDNEHVGAAWRRQILEEDRPVVESSRKELFTTGNCRPFTCRVRLLGNEVHHLRVRRVPLLADDGTVAYCLSMNEDITDIVKSHAKIRALNRRVEGVREQERRAVAYQLHEGVAQDLFAAKLAIGSMHAQPLSAAAQELVKEVDFLLTGAMARLKDLTGELRPQSLDHGGLVKGLEQLIGLLQPHTTCRISLVAGHLPAIDDEATVVLFRAAQEALRNALQHAGATKITVSTHLQSGLVRLVVEDNGHGITDQDRQRPDALGLVGVEERLAGVGGYVAIDGRDGKGTRVELYYPVERAALPKHLSQVIGQ